MRFPTAKPPSYLRWIHALRAFRARRALRAAHPVLAGLLGSAAVRPALLLSLLQPLERARLREVFERALQGYGRAARLRPLLHAGVALACSRKDEALLTRLVAAGASLDVESFHHKGASVLAAALIDAVDWGEESSAEWEWAAALLAHGADPNAPAKIPELLPLAIVLHKVSPRGLDLLLEHGAAAGALAHPDVVQKTLLSSRNADAAPQETADALRRLLDAGWRPALPAGEGGLRSHPLHRTAHLGMAECLAILWDALPAHRYVRLEPGGNLMHTLLTYLLLAPHEVHPAILHDEALWAMTNHAGQTPAEWFASLSGGHEASSQEVQWKTLLDHRLLAQQIPLAAGGRSRL